MALKFKDFLKKLETNVPGGMGDYATGAYMGSDQTGSETQSDARGMLPSTDLGIVAPRPVTGTIKKIKYKDTPIKIEFMDDHGKYHWIDGLSRDQFERIKPQPSVGKRITVVYQSYTDHIDKITVQG